MLEKFKKKTLLSLHELEGKIYNSLHGPGQIYGWWIILLLMDA